VVTIERPSTGAPGIGSKTLITLAAIAAVLFVVIAALPYRAMLGSEDVAKRTLQDFQFSYYPKRAWLLTHIAGGLIARCAAGGSHRHHGLGVLGDPAAHH
jgi:hypothetical protein